MAVAVLLSLAMVAGAGIYLFRTTSTARADVVEEFDGRVRTAADLIAGTLAASDAKTRALGEASFSGTAAQLARGTGREHLDTDWLAVLRGDGTVLAADPVTFAPSARTLRANGGFGTATRTGKLTFGDVRGSGRSASVVAFQPFTAPDGLRLLALPVPLADVAVIVSGTLAHPHTTSYLVDGTGVVIASSAGVAGEPLPDRALASAVRTSAQGDAGQDHYSARAVAGTEWRLVMTTPRSHLLAPVQATSRVAWQLFGAFAAAMAVILVIGVCVLVASARVARARLHDTLTGLPNRALFLERLEAAVGERRRGHHDDVPAVLFLDLDGFKPVNDTYGHAAGDALLKQVALRLVDATRPGDFVSRFGGDEFLVLCRGLGSDADALGVAARIQDYLTVPFEIDGRTVHVGVSIGIATLDDHVSDAAALIHDADVALYRAKENGRGRVELFTGPDSDALNGPARATR